MIASNFPVWNTSLVTANALNILDWLHNPQQYGSVLIVGSFPVGCQIATKKMMPNNYGLTMMEKVFCERETRRKRPKSQITKLYHSKYLISNSSIHS